MRTLGVGMVGFGFIGKVHAHAHRSLPLFYDPPPAATRLIGVCTASEETARKAASQGGFDIGTIDYRELLERDDIQLIHICTPNDEHYAAVRDALDAGKHVYCDKPLALNETQAGVLADRARRVGVIDQMTFNYRYVPAIMRAVALLDAGFIGDLFSFRAAYLHAGYIDPARQFSWRTDFARSGGGAIMDLGAHVIDLARFLLDRPAVGRAGRFVEVSAELQTVIPERPDKATGSLRSVDVDDIAWVQCRLAGGARGTIEASRFATGVQDELRIELHGSRGSLRFNLMDPNWLDAYDASLPEAPLGGDRGYRRIECVMRYPAPYALGATKNAVGWLNFHIQSLYDFVDNVARHEEGLPRNPHSPTFDDGLAVNQFVAACHRSALADGAWTAVDAAMEPEASGQPA